MFLRVNSQSILLKNALFSPFLLHFDFYTQFEEIILAVRHILYLCSLPSQSVPVVWLHSVSPPGASSLLLLSYLMISNFV